MAEPSSSSSSSNDPLQPPQGEHLFQSWGRVGQPLTKKEVEEMKEKHGTVRDPADPDREVPANKGNTAYLVHQKWQALQEKKKKEREAKGIKEGGGVIDKAFLLMLKWSLVALLTAAAAGQFVAGDPIWGYRGKYLQWRTYFPTNEKLFTPAELALYNGRDPDRPIYLAILGHVYDVSANKRTYGPGGSYSFFTGKDASRAYVTGCFTLHLTHDIRGFDDEQMEQLEGWKQFFDDNKDYPHIGYVDNPEIDPDSPMPPWKC